MYFFCQNNIDLKYTSSFGIQQGEVYLKYTWSILKYTLEVYLQYISSIIDFSKGIHSYMSAPLHKSLRKDWCVLFHTSQSSVFRKNQTPNEVFIL